MKDPISHRENFVRDAVEAANDFSDGVLAFSCAYGAIHEVFANVCQDLEEELVGDAGADSGGFGGAYADLTCEYEQFEVKSLDLQFKLLPRLREFDQHSPGSDGDWSRAHDALRRVLSRAAELVNRANEVFELVKMTAQLAGALFASWESQRGVVSLFVFDRPRLAKLVEKLDATRRALVRKEQALRERGENRG